MVFHLLHISMVHLFNNIMAHEVWIGMKIYNPANYIDSQGLEGKKGGAL